VNNFEAALDFAQTADLETLLNLPTHEKAELQNALLAKTVELVYEGHRFYRSRMRAQGLVPGDITTTEELVRLPVTTKQDFLADPDAFRLDHPALPAEMSTIWEVIYTTGTSSGRPAPVYTTTFDHLSYMHTARRRGPFIPLRESDVVVSVFPLTPFPMGAYSRAISEAAAFGCALVTAQTGRPPAYFGVHRSLADAAQLVATHQGTVLWGVASFVRQVLLNAEERGLDFSALRMVMITGEASSTGVIQAMERRLRRLGTSDGVVINRYGSTEQGNTMVECSPGSGFHNLAPDQVFLEVVEPETGQRLPDGQTGAFAFTHLLRRGTVLLRYAPGDVATLSHAPCPSCGRRSSERMSSDVRRAGSIQKVKGTLVDLHALLAQLETLDDVTEFQLVLRATDPEAPEVINDLTVRYACDDGDVHLVSERIARMIEQVGRVRPTLERRPSHDIFDPEQAPKAVRLIDERAVVAR
jgi:phenylacetate-CoA ligase